MSTAEPSTPVAGLDVIGVEKSFGPTGVLRGVDLAVPGGALLAVLGPSGCGKTTLLRAIAGFIPVDRGAIRVDGRTMVDDGTWVAPERRRAGIVPQDGALFPHLSVGRNVAFGIAASATRGAQVARWLEMVGLSHAVDARPHELSGGQQQRVALARALAAEPALVLLDEPFASLDAALRVQVRAEVANVLRETGRTAVLVTHDQQEALSTADHVAVMLDGRIEQLATPAEIYRRPASLAVARFVGETVVFDGTASHGVVHGPLGRYPLANDVVDGPVHVVLRPEQISIDASGSSTVVRRRTFTGPDIVLQLEVHAGFAVTCRAAGDVDVELGDRVGISVRGPVLAYARSSD